MLDLYEVAEKLIGPIDPAGETHTDKRRLENLKTSCDLIYRLVSDVKYVAIRNMFVIL